MVNPNETPSWDRPASTQAGAYSVNQPQGNQPQGGYQGGNATDSKTDAAKDVAQNAGEQAKDVAQNAGEQAKNVAQNAGEQAKDVADHATDAAKDVAGNAADRAKDVADTAKSEAGDVKDAVVATGSQVVDTAKEQVGNVVEEAKLHGQALLDEGLAQAKEQAQVGQAKLAEIVRDFTDELGGIMRGEQPQQGLATQLVGNAHGFAETTSNWLEQATPEQVVTDVRRFAARNPFTFMALAFGAGVVGGRVIRGLQAAKSDEPKALPRKVQTQRPVQAQPRREFNTPQVQTTQVQNTQYNTTRYDAPQVGNTGFATDLPAQPYANSVNPYGEPANDVFDQEAFGTEPPRADAPAQYGNQAPYGEDRR